MLSNIGWMIQNNNLVSMLIIYSEGLILEAPTEIIISFNCRSHIIKRGRILLLKELTSLQPLASCHHTTPILSPLQQYCVQRHSVPDPKTQ